MVNKEMEKLLETPIRNKIKDYTQKDLEQFKCDNYNAKVGKLNENDGIECDKCKNKGLIGIVLYDEMYGVYEFNTKTCECFRKRQLVHIARKNGFEELIKLRAKDYKRNYDWQKSNYDKMLKYCFEETESNKWFISLGQVGSGKTMIASIISNNILYNTNREIFYINWLVFINKIKRDLANDNISEVNDSLDHLKNVDVLFLDDVLKKYVETDLKYIYEIINYRYTNNLKTIITSEYSVDELLNIDQATFSRMIQRANGYIIDETKDKSKNIRLQSLKIN